MKFNAPMAGRGRMFSPGVAAALAAALLFGAGTPAAKWLLHDMGPWLLAGLFYFGSGIGLTLFRVLSRAAPVHLARGEYVSLAGAILAGGVVAPVLLMFGLSGMSASGAALLLNAEALLTALIAWVVFKENLDCRIVLGMATIVAGALVLSWPAEARFAGAVPALAVLAACLAWAIDNNLTRQVALADASWIATVKGLVAGSINLALALSLGDRLPAWPAAVAAAAVGFIAYGVSLVLFVVGMRQLGVARTTAYFSVAPFFGAILAFAGGEALTPRLGAAALLMAVGIWLHLTERHVHAHQHAAIEHHHAHRHDEHHRHPHDLPANAALTHAHRHRHEAQTHSHAHFPDAHHGDHRH